MKAPLDEELTQGQTLSSKLTRRPVLRAIIYLLLMAAGQVGIEYWLTRVLSFYSLQIVLRQLAIPLLISLGLEVFRWGLHRWQEKKADHEIPRDPFWFQVLEGAFAIWLLIEVLPAIVRILGF